jgi:hypothetical protein
MGTQQAGTVEFNCTMIRSPAPSQLPRYLDWWTGKIGNKKKKSRGGDSTVHLSFVYFGRFCMALTVLREIILAFGIGSCSYFDAAAQMHRDCLGSIAYAGFWFHVYDER